MDGERLSLEREALWAGSLLLHRAILPHHDITRRVTWIFHPTFWPRGLALDRHHDKPWWWRYLVPNGKGLGQIPT